MNINCVNIHNYCSNNGYLDNFGLIEVGNVWSKMCKACYFFEFTKAGVIAFRLSLVGRVKKWGNKKWGRGRKSDG